MSCIIGTCFAHAGGIVVIKAILLISRIRCLCSFTYINTMFMINHIVLCYMFLKLCYVYCNVDMAPVTFTFKEYQYKDTPKNEMTFREFETACEQSSACSHMAGLVRIRCVRECVSPSCYRDLYQADPLEDGEIDVRLNSFKGCFVQRSGRTRN